VRIVKPVTRVVVAAAAFGAVCSLNSQTPSPTNAAAPVRTPVVVPGLNLSPGSSPSAPVPAPAPDLVSEIAKLRAEAQRQIAERDALIAKLKQAAEGSAREAAYYRGEWKALRLRDEAIGVDLITGDERRLQQKLVTALQDVYTADEGRRKLAAQVGVLLRTLETIAKDASFDPQKRADVEAVIRSTRLAMQQATSKPAEPAGELLNAKVIQTRPELNLAVLNVGTVQGARQGMMFTVFDAQGAPVALLKAVDVRESLLGATVEERFQAADVSAGQAAKVKVQK
jgi:hypothetical protein